MLDMSAKNGLTFVFFLFLLTVAKKGIKVLVHSSSFLLFISGVFIIENRIVFITSLKCMPTKNSKLDYRRYTFHIGMLI